MDARPADGGKADVDAIWQQLKQQHAQTRHKAPAEALWRSLASGTGDVSAKQRRSQVDAATKQLARLLQQPCGVQPVAATAGACPAPEQPDLSKAQVERLTQALQSSDAGAVRAALQQMQAAAARLTPCHPLASKLGKALLRTLDHRSEACRELAASGLAALLQADPDATLPLLPYAMPVLEERLHADESNNPTEPSEEIRLQLLQLLSLVMQQAGPAIAAYASEVVSILTASLSDSFHEAAIQGCRATQQLAGTLGRRLGGTAKDLATTLLPLTTHNRHRVRVAAIQAIRDAVHQGGHEAVLDMTGWRDPNLVPVKAFYGDSDLRVNFCGKLATDSHMQVRLAFLDAVGSWMLSLGERRDHEARLLPYVLSAMCDQAPPVVGAAVRLLDALGAAYEQEHSKELADLVRFEGQMEDSGGAGAAGLAAVRPRLGSRLLVRNNLGTLLPALCRELSSWQAEPRGMAAKLLCVTLLAVEAAAERHLHAILPALCSAVSDPEAGAAAADCALVLGACCSLPLLVDALECACLGDHAAEPQAQARALLVLQAVLRGAMPCGRAASQAGRLRQLLGSPWFEGCSDTVLGAAARAVSAQLAADGVGGV